jgi:hypothetical protein
MHGLATYSIASPWILTHQRSNVNHLIFCLVMRVHVFYSFVRCEAFENNKLSLCHFYVFCTHELYKKYTCLLKTSMRGGDQLSEINQSLNGVDLVS